MLTEIRFQPHSQPHLSDGFTYLPQTSSAWEYQYPFQLPSFKDGVAARQYASDLSSSPPFFSGSPPCRVMNPLIHDAQFSNQKQHRLSSSPSPSTSPSSSCKGRCARARLGKPHSPNRVEGFDCLNSRMAAMA
ncbi:uncharacterized protein [Solanum tuberosum]|uniref:uncharacterized protein isoform X2 n=1 Tax=Solanum tuberosum TaxID=4113 RepID=UPI000739FDE1|nr:PREDICTED: uncharacterized protein LOC102582226 isoform X2 [Solanum tuberosum]